MLDLPYDYPASAQGHVKGAAYSCLLSRQTVEQLQGMAAQRHATLFMVLLAGFFVFLNRLTGQRDLIVGMPVAGRDHPDVKEVIGFFVNTVMLRHQVDREESFAQLLERVRDRTLAVLRHQHYPFEQLLDELKVMRSVNRFPVSPVFFNMHNFVHVQRQAQHKTASHRPLYQDMKFDLDIYMHEHEEGVVFDCHYRTALLKPATIAYWLEQYLHILGQIAPACDRPVKEIDCLRPVRRLARPGPRLAGHPFEEFSAEAEALSIPARFEQQVGRYGDKVAIQTESVSLTYAELNRKANALAAQLVSQLGAANDRVGLLFEHGADMVVGILGALKAAKAYVPLDPEHPEARLRYMSGDSGARALVTHSRNMALAERLFGNTMPIVNVDALVVDEAASRFVLRAGPEDAAYVLYTSGSTGQPKGVLQSHRNVLHYLRRYTNHLHIGASDRQALFASYGFEAGVKGIFAPLLNGGSVYPYKLSALRQWGGLAQWLHGNGITIWHSIPALYRNFLKNAGASAAASVRVVVLSGEELLPSDIALHKGSRFSHAVMVNLYGLTEASLNLLWEVDPEDAAPVRLGYPFAEDEVAILDEAGRACGLYEVGEIIIQAWHVAKGYGNNTDLTARSFVQLGDGRIRYRTADLGVWLPEGSIQLRGRRGEQTKIRGYRIELGEIENVLLEHPCVRAAAVIAQSPSQEERRLLAYVEVDGSIPAEQVIPVLREHAQKRLPVYMVPALFTLLDRLPLTPNGKVDRGALPSPLGAAEARSYVAPRNATEEKLAALCAEVLGRQKVSVEDNFFEIGGHSLLAMQLISRIRQTFNVDLPLQEMFAHPTVAAVAKAVEVQMNAQTLLEPPIDNKETQETIEF